MAACTYPLNELRVAKSNTRKVKPSAREVEEMAASIRSHKLIHPLAVTPDADGGAFVIDGRIRLEAFLRLANEGEVEGDEPIACNTVEVDGPESESEVSLTANINRVAMHPADQAVAFSKLHKGGRGSTVEEIATRFGYTPRTVQKRLRLGGLHPKILTAYRAGSIDTRTAEAFTLSTDRAEQLEVWDEISERTGHVMEWQVRKAFTQEKMSLDSPLVSYAGLDRYREEGGTVTEDLFAAVDESHTFVDDPALLVLCAGVKLDKVASRVRKQGWKWVEVCPHLDWDYLHGFSSTMGDQLSPEKKALSGVIVTIDCSGKAAQHVGLIKNEDKKEATALSKAESEGDGDPGIRNPSTAAQGAAAPAHPARDAGLTDAISDDLQYIRTNLVKVALAGSPEIARDLLTFTLACSVIGEDGQDGLSLTPRTTDTRPVNDPDAMDAFELCNSGRAELLAIGETLRTRHAGWLDLTVAEEAEQAWRPPGADRWETFRGLEQAEKDELLAYAVAAQVENQMAFDRGRSRVLEAVIESLAPPFGGQKWTAPVLWNRLSKKALLGILEEVAGPEVARDHKGDKKGDLAAFVDQTFSDTTELPSGHAGLVQAWRPPGFDADTAEEGPE